MSSRIETGAKNPKDIVRAGYEQIAGAYLATRTDDGADAAPLREFGALLPAQAHVLDAGCGSGVPAARYLSVNLGFDVIGVDFAAAQIELARENVPGARFVQADLTALAPPEFPDDAFDGICSLYAVIHIPREEHPAVLANFRRMLRPGGLLLLTTGFNDVDDGHEDDWLGVPMYWSHFGRAGNLELVEEAGFQIIWEREVREHDDFGGGSHLFILARKPAH